MAELSEHSGVPVATLKYYLREGLLPAGQAQSATRSDYSEDHLARVRLIRAMVEGAGMSIAAVRRVVAALDDPPSSRHELLGVAQHALPAPFADHEVSKEVLDLLDELGWRVSPGAPALRSLSGAIQTARSAGVPLAREALRRYARATEQIAAVDVGAVPTDDASAALARVVVGTVLVDPVLAALRRLAQEHTSGLRQQA
jgi:DNA-binding transcriptional MerR regulator